MIKEIQFRKAALREIEESYQWYEKHQEGLGDSFMLCVEETLKKKLAIRNYIQWFTRIYEEP